MRRGTVYNKNVKNDSNGKTGNEKSDSTEPKPDSN